jgi:hypothetical protein
LALKWQLVGRRIVPSYRPDELSLEISKRKWVELVTPPRAKVVSVSATNTGLQKQTSEPNDPRDSG